MTFIKSTIKTVTLHSKITEIGDYAFYDCDLIESVTIPASVTKLGVGAENAPKYCAKSIVWVRKFAVLQFLRKVLE